MTPDEKALISKIEGEVVCALLNSEAFRALLKDAQKLNLGALEDISVIMTFKREIKTNEIDQRIPLPNSQDEKILKALRIIW